MSKRVFRLATCPPSPGFGLSGRADLPVELDQSAAAGKHPARGGLRQRPVCRRRPGGIRPHEPGRRVLGAAVLRAQARSSSTWSGTARCSWRSDRAGPRSRARTARTGRPGLRTTRVDLHRAVWTGDAVRRGRRSAGSFSTSPDGIRLDRARSRRRRVRRGRRLERPPARRRGRSGVSSPRAPTARPGRASTSRRRTTCTGWPGAVPDTSPWARGFPETQRAYWSDDGATWREAPAGAGKGVPSGRLDGLGVSGGRRVRRRHGERRRNRLAVSATRGPRWT